VRSIGRSPFRRLSTQSEKRRCQPLPLFALKGKSLARLTRALNGDGGSHQKHGPDGKSSLGASIRNRACTPRGMFSLIRGVRPILRGVVSPASEQSKKFSESSILVLMDRKCENGKPVLDPGLVNATKKTAPTAAARIRSTSLHF
jgi:hypothetical protein